MTRGLISLLFVVALTPLASAHGVNTPESLRARISQKIDQAIGKMSDIKKGEEPNFLVSKNVEELHHLVESYLVLTATKFEFVEDDSTSLRYFKITPNLDGSWINHIAVEMSAKGVAYYIRPVSLIDRYSGYYETKTLSVTMIAPPFTGQLSSVLAHELAHHVVITIAQSAKLPLFERVWAGFTSGYIRGYPFFHFSEMTAISSSLLNFQKIPYSIELSDSENQKIQAYAKRLYQFTLIISYQLSSYLNQDDGISKIEQVPLLDREALVIQNESGSKFFFENFNFKNPNYPLSGRLLKRFLPNVKQADGVHFVDLANNKRKVHELYRIIRDLEGQLRPFTDMPANRIRVKAHLPWEYLQEANSRWLTVLGLPKDHPGHEFVNSHKGFILCGAGKDPVCQPIMGCEGLLE